MAKRKIGIANNRIWIERPDGTGFSDGISLSDILHDIPTDPARVRALGEARWWLLEQLAHKCGAAVAYPKKPERREDLPGQGTLFPEEAA